MSSRTAPAPHHEDPWAKFFLIGVCVTVLDLLLYPYVHNYISPYVGWGTIILFLALGAAAGYLLAWRRSSGYVLLVPTGAVLGIVAGYELTKIDPAITAAIIVGVAASGLSMGIGALVA
jgi:hypothetical protein